MRSKIWAGIVAGLVAGLVFGVLMQTMTTTMSAGSMEAGAMGGGMRVPMITMMAQVVRSDSIAIGWLYVLVNSVLFGAIFGSVLGGRAARPGRGLTWGALFGLALWVLGALLLMPILLGMEALSPLTVESMRPGAVKSLAAHLIAGLVVGGVFAALYRDPPAARPSPLV